MSQCAEETGVQRASKWFLLAPLIMSVERVDKSVVRLVSWCFKLSQPQRIISGQRETFIKDVELKGPVRQK